MSLRSRLIQILGLGRGTTPATDGGKIRTVQMKFMTTGETRGEVPFMQHYGFASRPHAGCDFAVIALDHHPGKSVIIASNDQRYQVALTEGEAVLFDDQGQVIHLTRDGITIRDKSGNTIVTSPAGIVHTDASGSTVTMAEGGIALAPQNKVVTVDGEVEAAGNAGTGMTVAGDLRITGGITATGDIVAGFGGAGAISLLGHEHQVIAVGSPTTAPIAGT